MLIRILCVGKLKQTGYKTLCQDYSKRLGRFAKVEVVEVADEPAPETLSAALQEKIKRTEGQRLLEKAKPGYGIALCLEGQAYDSEQWAEKCQQLIQQGHACLQFFLGGSLGLSDEVIEKCQLSLSLSKLTFPHNLARLVLLEQLYRSFKINNRQPYHK